MKKFEITFHKPGSRIFSANIILTATKSADEVKNYYTSKGYEVAGVSEFYGLIKPGQPVYVLS